MATIAIGVDRGPGEYTCRIPVNSLSESGVPPEEGDTVEYSVSGTVTSVSDGEATVKIDSVNGEPVGEEASETPEEEAAEPGGGLAGAGESAAQMGSRLKKAARGLPMPPG